ncbi:uncharacterized protein PV09_07455 [Verruconis gallopava]|uniref:FAD-binding FR-type domain-containing protein n=1 Tax=Verruconis gallopava TaxID=253628 RepID=A0A0D1XG51_9PEZI|nr:uncharacterized protein PV09_07455 [Verruconis gallopava]KIW01171.1 hypothetical protein PV09_07455 [Verruconis gallopava]
MASMQLVFFVAFAATSRAQSSAAPAAAQGSAAPQTAGQASSAEKETNPEALNWFLIKGLLWAWIGLVGGTMIYCFFLHCLALARTLACLNNEKQKYFSWPLPTHSAFRKYLVDAPLFRKRHHREFRLSSAINVGTLPSRAQTLFLVLYVATSIFLTLFDIDFGAPSSQIYSMLVNRTGMMAIMNMVPLFLLAGRNNPLITLTGITFDTYNLIHRWLGRIVVTEAVLHGTFWIVNKVQTKGFAAFQATLANSEFILSGFIGAVAFAAILVQSPSALRHAFYETFLVGHQLLAALAVAAVWVHLKEPDYYYQHAIIKGVVAIWAAERGIRLARLLYGNLGRGGTTAEVEALPGEAVRVTVKMARPWRFRTGAHAYLYMPGIGWWTSHPFSIAWSEEMSQRVDQKRLTLDPEKGFDMETSEVLRTGEHSMSFIIRRRTGFTDKLWKKAERTPEGRFVTKCWLEGPYGHQTLHSYGTVLLFAAGVGITHQVPHVRDLVAGYANGTVAARKVTLVWIIQSPEHLEWIRPWMTAILSMPKRREVLKIMLFVTKPKSTKEIQSPSASVQMFPGKPNISALVDQEVASAIGAIGVSVCGVGALADDVRKCCRSWMTRANIEFSEEAFSW